MKADKNGWPRLYLAALSKYLDQGPGASLRPALGLGRRAVALGLKTLDLARFHEHALMVLAPNGVSSRAGQRTIERAKRFFAETAVPVENSHRAALKAGIRVSMTAFAGVEKLSSAKRTALYRVAQEALANTARHARASRVKVTILRLANDVCMEIKDNGRSFDMKRVLRSKRVLRLGLLGMRERVEMVGGRFAVESAPVRGTTVRAWIPFGDGAMNQRPV